MKINYLFLLISVIAMTSCAGLQKAETLDAVKTNLNCIEYKEGTMWKDVADNMGAPDIAPLPQPGADLGRNARIYRDRVVIFHTDRQEVDEGGKTRFREVVNRIEVCKCK